jgi:hypothetical protein
MTASESTRASTEWDRTCVHCGAAVQHAARRCLACGKDLEGESRSDGDGPAPRNPASRIEGEAMNTVTVVLLGACGAAGLALLVGLFVLIWSVF